MLYLHYHLKQLIEKSIHLFNLIFQPFVKFPNPYSISMQIIISLPSNRSMIVNLFC